jgi:hypothetical protein
MLSIVDCIIIVFSKVFGNKRFTASKGDHRVQLKGEKRLLSAALIWMPEFCHLPGFLWNYGSNTSHGFGGYIFVEKIDVLKKIWCTSPSF